jgi:hypothetical protein
LTNIFFIPHAFFTGKIFSRLFDLTAAWRFYRSAMDRRRPGSALSHNAFGHYARHRCSVYASLRGSALFGQFQEFDGRAVFCVSHQAPVSHRDGVELLKKLASDRNTWQTFKEGNDGQS